MKTILKAIIMILALGLGSIIGGMLFSCKPQPIICYQRQIVTEVNHCDVMSDVFAKIDTVCFEVLPTKTIDTSGCTITTTATTIKQIR